MMILWIKNISIFFPNHSEQPINIHINKINNNIKIYYLDRLKNIEYLKDNIENNYSVILTIKNGYENLTNTVNIWGY